MFLSWFFRSRKAVRDFPTDPGPSFSRMSSQTSASRGAAQCRDAFKAEVSFWCCPDLLFSCQGAGGKIFTPLSFKWTKKSGVARFFGKKKFFFVNFLIIHGIRHPKLRFTRFTEHCFYIDFLPLTYNGKDKWFFSRSPGKYIFHLHLFPLPITAFQKRPFGQNRGVLEDIFFENHFTCK